MTITITYTDGTTASYTSCSGYSNSGGIVSFHGTDSDGNACDVEIPFANCKSIKRTTTG